MLSDDGFEIPWRPAYEGWAVVGWGLSATSILLLGSYFKLPLIAVFSGVLLSAAMLMWQANMENHLSQ